MQPTLLLSLDKELIWGIFDHTSPAEFLARNSDPRTIVRRLLALLEEFEVPATWAVVGHLFLSSCRRGGDGRAHPELSRPSYSWYREDWFGKDPCTDRATDPLWYGDDIIDLIAGATTAQEIGCHSFSHLVFGDPGCSADAAAADLSECVRLADARGIKLRSLVFPRNKVGHLAIARDHGFVTYRGADPMWYRSLPSLAQRGAHLIDQAAALKPPVSLPAETLPGLWNLPGSMLLLHRDGLRRFVSLSARVAKAKAGLARAIRERKIFHLWFHPSNLGHDREAMFGVLREILTHAARLRARGLLEISTMGELGGRLQLEKTAAGVVEREFRSSRPTLLEKSGL